MKILLVLSLLLSTYEDAVACVCEESASISISSESIASFLSEVTSTCLNVRDGCKLVSHTVDYPWELYSASPPPPLPTPCPVGGGDAAAHTTTNPPPIP